MAAGQCLACEGRASAQKGSAQNVRVVAHVQCANAAGSAQNRNGVTAVQNDQLSQPLARAQAARAPTSACSPPIIVSPSSQTGAAARPPTHSRHTSRSAQAWAMSNIPSSAGPTSDSSVSVGLPCGRQRPPGAPSFEEGAGGEGGARGGGARSGAVGGGAGWRSDCVARCGARAAAGRGRAFPQNGGAHGVQKIPGVARRGAARTKVCPSCARDNPTLQP
jgi:hypothetical protein